MRSFVSSLLLLLLLLFFLFRFLFPPFSSRLALAMRVYFPNRDAEPSANARQGRFGDSDEADKPIARHQGIVQGVRVRSAAATAIT